MDGTIEIEFYVDDEIYCASWRPVQAIGAGRTMVEALGDLRQAVVLAIDCCIAGALAQEV